MCLLGFFFLFTEKDFAANLISDGLPPTPEQVDVMGTIGLLRAMIENQLLTVDGAIRALDRMNLGKRRLPWAEAEKILSALR